MSAGPNRPRTGAALAQRPRDHSQCPPRVLSCLGKDANPLGLQVALKRIAIDSSEGFPIYAIREIRILSSLRHDNIVNLREIVRDPACKL